MKLANKVMAIAALSAFSAISASAQVQAPRTLQQYRAAERLAQQQLAKFDTLDFEVFSNQDWDRLKESHAHDIAVHWPDGHVTHGIDRHISDLKELFAYAPDTRIKEHPIRVGSGEWTRVTGFMEGTFTRPMTTPDGTVIPPNGRTFRLPMATIGHWKNGVMDAEYLFLDNQTYVTQLGLSK